MKVRKLSESELKDSCDLISRVISYWDIKHIIFIDTGGTKLKKYLKLNPNCVIHTVQVRHNRSLKLINFKKVFKLVPNFILDLMRILDYYFPKSSNRFVEFTEDLSELTGLVVIVDDCIDTGATLDCVIGELATNYKIVSINDIKGERSDVFIFSGCICKFPWNLDY